MKKIILALMLIGTVGYTASRIPNSGLANMAQSTFKGRASGAGTGVPVDLTSTQATAILNNVVGDSGSGGTKGLVPAPSAGDAAADKFLKADGTWATAGTSDHGGLTGLSDDDHPQYALLAGRSGGQALLGGTGSGDDISFDSTSHSTKGFIAFGPLASTTPNNPIHFLLPNSSSLTNGLVISENSSSWPATVNAAGPQGVQILPKDNGGSLLVKVVGSNNQSFLKHVNGSDGTYTGYFSMGLPWGFMNNNSGLTTFKVSGTTGQSVDIVQYSNQSDFSNTVSSIGSGGQFRAPVGTLALPGQSFHTDTNTGLYGVAADTIGFSGGGVDLGRIDSAGLTLGLTGTTQGRLKLAGATSGTVTISADNSTTSWNLTLPTSKGTTGYSLDTDGNGVTSWVNHLPVSADLSATSEIDWSTLLKSSGIYAKTLTADTTFTFSNKTVGQTIVVRLCNTTSNRTVTWPTVKWPAAATPTMTTGDKCDIYTFIYDGTSVFGNAVQNL